MDSINISRESIFISAIRSFCNAFFTLLGLGACLIVVILGFVLAFGGLSGGAAGQKVIVSIEPDAQGNRTPLPVSAPVILKITLDGIVGTRDLITSNIENLLLESRNGLLKNDRVKGIILHVNTPGGSNLDSYGIYSAIKSFKERYKIPVYAFVDGMCASGGMYICSAADKIYASPISIVGSIGVILGPVLNFYGLMEKWGIQSKVIAKGKNKAMLNPFTSWKPGEDDSLEVITDYLYQQFVDVVVSARPNLNRSKLVNEYGAQVYAAPKGEELGFIDASNASYNGTLKELVAACGIKENESYQVVELETPKSVFATVMGGANSSFLAKIFNKFYGVKEDLFELNSPFLCLYQPGIQ